MTNISEEKLKRLIMGNYSAHDDLSQSFLIRFKDKLMVAIESGQLNADDWVSVAEDVPEFRVDVLARLVSAKGKKRYSVAQRRDRQDAEWFIDGCEVHFDWNVTMWQPIEPPKQDKA